MVSGELDRVRRATPDPGRADKTGSPAKREIAVNT